MEQGGAKIRSGEDRISSLPDPLLCQILSNLRTKDVVRTSVLSSRWTSLWLSVPILDLDAFDFPDYITFTSFVSRFLNFSTESSLHKFKLFFTRQDCDLPWITSWIETAVIRKVQHLEVDCDQSFECELMPLSLYLCDTLITLRLRYVALHSFEFASLPNLKVMHLEEIQYACDELLEKLISSCPVLEDLTVFRNVDETVKVLRVCSQTLNRLNLVLDSCKSWYIDDSEDWEVLIDAPRLINLIIQDDQSVRFDICNLSSSAKVDIDVAFYVTDIEGLDDSFNTSFVSIILTGLSTVKDMSLSGTTMKFIWHYLKHGPMPPFHNMIRFQTQLYVSDLEKLPHFLESCPNLKSLDLKMKGKPVKEEISLSSVPKCLKSSLEYIEMTRPKYFLENSLILKKVTLRLRYLTKYRTHKTQEMF